MLVAKAGCRTRQEYREKGCERQNAQPSELHQKHNHHLSLEGKTRPRGQHRQAGDTTCTGSRKESIHQRNAIRCHTRQRQQNGADHNQSQKRDHHHRGGRNMYPRQQRTCLRQIYHHHHQKIELYKKQINVLEIVIVKPLEINAEERQGYPVSDKQDNDNELAQRTFEMFFFIDGIKKKDEIFERVKHKRSVNDDADKMLHLGRNVKSVIPDDADNGQQGNEQTANIKSARDTVLVLHNVKFQLLLKITQATMTEHLTDLS